MKLNRTILPVFLLAFAGLLCRPESSKLDKDQLEARYHAKVERDSRESSSIPILRNGMPGLRINPPKGELFDFSGAKYLAVDVENLSKDRQLRTHDAHLERQSTAARARAMWICRCARSTPASA